MGQTDYFLEAVKDLYYWQYGDGSSFAAHIFFMFQKADSQNLERLRLGFPDHFNAWSEWVRSPSQDQFFEKYGFQKRGKKNETER